MINLTKLNKGQIVRAKLKVRGTYLYNNITLCEFTSYGVVIDERTIKFKEYTIRSGRKGGFGKITRQNILDMKRGIGDVIMTDLEEYR